jgi:plasmid segregation protein ParM
VKNYAIDAGFGRTKATEGKRICDFPSLVAAYRPVRFVSGMEKKTDPTTRLVLQYENNRYYIGSAAARQGIAQNTIDKERAVGIEGKLLSLAALGILAEEETEHINLVAGLPVSHYAGLKNRYYSAMKQTHRFSLLKLTGEIERHLIINVVNLKIIPQPLGTLFNMLLSETGGIERAELAGENVGIIDIGYHTADLARADSLEFIDRKSASYPLGLFGAYCELSDSINQEFGIEAAPESLEEVMRTGLINIAGGNVNVEHLITQALEAAAGQIVSKVKSLWPDRWQLNRIIVTGGGGATLYNHLLANIDEQAELAETAIYANVKGYFKLAARTWRD